MGETTRAGPAADCPSARIRETAARGVFACISGFLHPGDVKQTFSGHAAFCPRALHLVDATKIRWRDPLALAPFAPISASRARGRYGSRNFTPARLVQTGLRPCRNVSSSRAGPFGFISVNWSGRIRSSSSYPRWEIDPYEDTRVAVRHSERALILLALIWSARQLLPLSNCAVVCSRRNGALSLLFFAAAYYVVSLFPVLGFFSVYFFRYSFVSCRSFSVSRQYWTARALTGAGIATLLGRFCETPNHFWSHPDWTVIGSTIC